MRKESGIKKIINAVKSLSGFGSRSMKRSSYQGAATTRIENDWNANNLTSDAILRWELSRLRARSRELSRNNEYIKKYLKTIIANIIGAKGIRLQSKVEGDEPANQKIEAAWAEWGKVASTSGAYDWHGLEELAIETCARDGEALFRIVTGFDNGFGFALQPLEVDLLDERLNEDLRNGNRIRMSIEFDQWERPVNYYLLTSHPGDQFFISGDRKYQIVPASEIIHIFKKERPNQSRGVPWTVASMNTLRMITSFQEATLIQQRLGAMKLGFFTSPTGNEYTGDAKVDNNVMSDFEPGSFEQLPDGVDFKQFDVDGVGDSYKEFMRMALRSASSGLGITYHSLTGDLSDVNFSSIRQGELEARDLYKMDQRWIISVFHERVFNEWLMMALLTGGLRLPLEKIDKFKAHIFQPRGWGWVDPKKDVEASILAINARLKSRTEVMADQGRDYEDTINQLAAEDQIALAAGISISSEEPQEASDGEADED